MATEIPLIMQRALALLRHHSHSEPKDSLYRIFVGELDLREALEGRYVDLQLHYLFGRLELSVHVRWDHMNKTYWMECRSPKVDEADPELVLRIAGMFVKAGNLMRQLKALQ